MQNQIRTDCENCVFAKISEGKQTGCEMGRADILGVAEMSNEGSFILDRFCNTFRPDQWTQELNFEESIDLKKTVLQEVCPRMGFFIHLKTEHVDPIINLKETIESITNIENGPAAFVVVINEKVEYNEEIWGLFLEYFDVHETKYHILQLNDELDEPIKSLDMAFIHAQNGWIYVSSSGEKIQANVISKLHEMLNVNMHQITMIESYDGFNGLMYPAYLFKFLNGNKRKVFQDETFDSRSFIDKMKSYEEKHSTKTIFNWEEFNAS